MSAPRATARRVAALAATVLATVALTAGPAGAATGSPAGPSTTSSSHATRTQAATPASAPSKAFSAASIPADCGIAFHRVTETTFDWYAWRRGKVVRAPFGSLGLTEPVKAMATVNGFKSGSRIIEQGLATTASGALYLVRNSFTLDGAFISTGVTQLKATGWGGMRELVASDSGYVYALTDGGGFYRYALSYGGVVKSAGTVATSGWSSIKSLSWAVGGTFNGAPVDGFIGTTTTGALVEYVVRVADLAPRSFVLRASGWSAFTHVSSGGCTSGPGRQLVGVTADGALYGFYDVNGLDLNGADIRGVGQIGAGFTGRVFD